MLNKRSAGNLLEVSVPKAILMGNVICALERNMNNILALTTESRRKRKKKQRYLRKMSFDDRSNA
jgi:hypothetical protein